MYGPTYFRCHSVSVPGAGLLAVPRTVYFLVLRCRAPPYTVYSWFIVVIRAMVDVAGGHRAVG